MWWNKTSDKSSGKQAAKKTVQTVQQMPRRKALMMALEPRYMFDGAVAATHAEAAHQLHAEAEHGFALDHVRTVAAAQTQIAQVAASGPAVVFVDSRVTDAASLLKGVAPGTEVVTLNANQDGLQQIASYLAAHREVGSVEIIAHGSDGELLLGDTNLTVANVNSYAQELGAIGGNLKQGADILVYACDTAADATGKDFVGSLAQLTGHAVAASTATVGRDGSWELGFETGDISAVPVLSATAEAAYGYDLGTIVVTSGNDSGAGTLRAAIATANSQSGDIIYFSGVSTVTLSSGVLNITSSMTIESDLAADGSSPVTINANHSSGVLNITGGSVTLIGLEIENGLISGKGGGFGVTAGGNAYGAGIAVTGGSTVVTMNHDYLLGNAATGGGGAGSPAAPGGFYAGGGGSGISGVGGAPGGSYAATGGVAAGSGGSGHGGNGGFGALTGYNGQGGFTTGGAGGGASSTYTAGGAGGTAGIVGGGGGGSGANNGTATTPGSIGGSAVGGLFVGSGSKVYMANTQFTNNYGAGGGGGGSYTGVAGNGGKGSGAVMVASTGILEYQNSTVNFTNNVGTGGSGGTSKTGGDNGTAGVSSGTTGIENPGGAGTVSSTYSPPTTVTSVAVPSNGTYHDGQTLSFTVNFTGNVTVTGTPELAITLDTGGTVQATYQSGSGGSALVFSYTVTAGEQDATGITVGALTLNSGTINDSNSNAAVLTLNNVASTSSVDVQAILPTVSSINIAGSSPTNGTSESFTVTYSEAMNPATVLNTDFTATQVSGSITDTGITVSEVSASVYTVTVNGVSGNGVLRLDMNSGTSEQDSYGNTISGGHTGDQTYTVDQTPPTVSSIVPAGANPGKGGSETFTVTFSEAVSGVDASDFTAVTSGTTDTGISSVTTADNIHYTVTVGGVGGNGTLGLNLNSSGTGITDTAGNAISGGLTGSTYTIDTTPPTVSSITALGSLTNNASSDAFTVTFSEAVTGVTASDFTLTTTNTPGGTALSTGGITSITTTDNIHYTVTVGSVTGDGTLRLDLKSNSTGITDAAGNGATAAFTSGDTYTIEHTPPTVSSSTANGTLTNNAGSEVFTVTFTENVSGVNSGDFNVNLTGTAAYTGIVVTPLSGSQYQVTVQGVTGDGTLQLTYNGSVHDVTDAAGNIASANFTSGDTYTVDHTAPTVSSVSVPANATYIAGQNLDFTVNFSEAVTVTGTPEIAITLDTGGIVYAQYLSGSGTSALTFRYTVVGNESDTNGIGVDSSITLNGGTIQDAATNDAVLTLNSVGSTTGVLVDSIPPAVSSVGVPTDGTYGAGQMLTFTVNFSENVLVTTGGGTPSIPITLDTGGTVQAAYVGGSGTSALTFAYTVTSGEADLNGISVGSAISLNGGTIKDAATNVALLALNSVASTANVLVDAVPPTVSSIDIAGTATNNGSAETFTVTFSVPVSGVDASDFVLNETNTVGASALVNADVVAVSPVNGRSATWTVTVQNVTGDGNLRLDLNAAGEDQAITDQFSNQLDPATSHTGDQSYTIDHTAPTITSVTPPATGTYTTAAGNNDITFSVNYSEPVTVDTTGGTPRIPVTLTTGGTVYANYVSGSGSSTLVFTLAVASGEQELSGIGVAGSVDTNGGTIRDAAANNAVETLTGLSSPLTGVDVDAIIPSVTAVGVPTSGTYGVGGDLDFTLSFSKAVTVDTSGGTPYIQITLDTGGTVDAVYLSGSGTSQLTFRYIVASGELDSNGITVGTTLFTGGGTIKDSAGNSSDTTLHGIAGTSGVLVDSVPPTATTIDIAGTSPNNASSETFTVTFDKPVNGVDATDFTVVGSGTASGAVSTVSGSGTTWTVTVGSVVGDGTLRLDLNNTGDAITDNYGNALAAAHTGDQTYTVQHTPPAATSMTVPADGTYGAGQNMDFTVTYSEIVNVDTTGGTPRIAISLDTGGTQYANYVSGSGTNTLTFRFAPVSGQQDLTGILTGTAVDTNGGTIRDAAGNNANLAINSVEPSTANVDVDAIIPVVNSVSVPASATYIAGQALDFTVNFNKPMTVAGSPYVTLTLATGGTVDAAYVSGSGTSSLVFEYVVAPNEGAPSGVVLGSAIVLNGGSIDDAHGNPVNPALNSIGSTSGVLVDSIPPVVSSIVAGGPGVTNATSETFTVTFSEPVTGVVASDFTLTETGSTTGAISSISGSGATYTVTVTGISGNGSMRLDLNGSGTGIADLATNAIKTGFTAGSVVNFDYSSAIIDSVGVPAAGTYTTGQTLDFTVTYDNAVAVVGTPRLSFTLDNGQTVYADYVSGSGTTTLTFAYTVAQGAIETTGLKLGGSIDNNGGSISDTGVGNPADPSLSSVGDSSHVYIDGTSPAVSSIATVGSSTTNAASVSYTVTFNEAVTGVNAGDFKLTASGSAAGTVASVTPVGSDGTTYTVTVNDISGMGTLRLDLNAGSGVADKAGTPVPGFTGGAVYTVDRVDSTVSSVGVPAAGDYKAGQTLSFRVNFTQPVTVDTTGGAPGIVLTLQNGATVQARYVSGSGSDTLVFSYTIADGDKAPNGIGVGASIVANGGKLTGADGNPAVLALAGVGPTDGVDIKNGNGDGGNGNGNGNHNNNGRGLLTGEDQNQQNQSGGSLAGSGWQDQGGSQQGGIQFVPTTTQTVWSSVPLTSSEPVGGTVRDSDTAVGSSGLSATVPSQGEQLVNPAPVELPALQGSDANHSNLLNWKPPGHVEQPSGDDLGSLDANSARALRGLPVEGRPAVPLFAQGHGRGVERHHGQKHAVVAHAGPQGKASLSQQFARYGKQAWEHDKAALVENARQSAQRRTG